MIPFLRVQDENGDVWAIPVQSIRFLFQGRNSNKCSIYFGDGKVAHSTVHLLEVQRGINAADEYYRQREENAKLCDEWRERALKAENERDTERARADRAEAEAEAEMDQSKGPVSPVIAFLSRRVDEWRERALKAEDQTRKEKK